MHFGLLVFLVRDSMRIQVTRNNSNNIDDENDDNDNNNGNNHTNAPLGIHNAKFVVLIIEKDVSRIEI